MCVFALSNKAFIWVIIGPTTGKGHPFPLHTNYALGEYTTKDRLTIGESQTYPNDIHGYTL